jgi:hypothetical protein
MWKIERPDDDGYDLAGLPSKLRDSLMHVQIWKRAWFPKD